MVNHDISADRMASCRRRLIQVSALSALDGRVLRVMIVGFPKLTPYAEALKEIGDFLYHFRVNFFEDEGGNLVVGSHLLHYPPIEQIVKAKCYYVQLYVSNTTIQRDVCSQ